MKKYGYALCFLFLVLFILAGCHGNAHDDISKALGIDVSKGIEIEMQDSHGGFHGDGMTFVALRFPNDSLQAQIAEQEHWDQLPLSENLTALAYGLSTDTHSVSPHLTDKRGNPVMPKIENGYYYFFDRQANIGSEHDDRDVFSRASYNFIFAIYDKDTNILYYVKFDT